MEPVITDAWFICRIRKSDLCFFRYTLESYEGLCVPTTMPGGEGRVRVSTTVQQRLAVEDLLRSLAEEIPLTVESWNQDTGKAEDSAAPDTR